MQVRQALKICPDLILIRPDFELYRSFSRRFMQIAYSYSPMVESMSIDECFVDITGSKQFGTPLEIAAAIQLRIMNELQLPCSIGVAPNKLLAKMGSDMKNRMEFLFCACGTCLLCYGTNRATIYMESAKDGG